MTLSPLDILQQKWGYDQFRGQQAEIIQTVTNGGDALVLMPTGGGKSLCYQIPALARQGTGLIVSPLIALMQDQVAALQELGISAAYLNSTLDSQRQYEVESALQNGQLDLLYIAPERLLQPRTLQLLQQCNLSLIAIDEAHCVSQWGHDFRPEYMRLAELVQQFPHVPRIALTATADIPTRNEIAERLQLQHAQHYVHSFDRPNICYRVAERGGGRNQLLSFIKNEHPTDVGIVYCLSRKKVEQTAEWLANEGIDAMPYHAGMPSQQRSFNLNRFLRDENVVMVATVAFGMGIDKPNVRYVAHLDLPSSIEAYYQETGRAGRDGQPSNAWMLYGLNDVVQRRQMIEQGQSSEERKRVERHKLDSMLAYCELSSCRRQNLLQYFGDETPPCGNCDTCQSPPMTRDATDSARKALSAVYRTGQRFGTQYIIEHLRGKKSERSDRFGHSELTTFGIGKELNDKEWRTLFRQLIATGLMGVDYAGYGGLKLNDSSRGLLRGEQTLLMRIEQKTSPGRKKKSGSHSNPADNALWEALKDLRKTIASENSVPPYVVFHDATLMEMIAVRPLNSTAFLSISGVSEKKLARYGEAFMKVIGEHPASVNSQKDQSLSPTAYESIQLFKSEKTVANIAESRGISADTVWKHLAEGIRFKATNVVDVVSLPAAELKQIETQMIEVRDQNEGRLLLKPVFEHFDECYSYGLLRCVAESLRVS